MNTALLDLLCCPACRQDLDHAGASLVCKRCNEVYPVEDGIAVFPLVAGEKGLTLSQQKWDEKYEQDSTRDVVGELDTFDQQNFDIIWKQIGKYRDLTPDEVFLEIGCGTFYFGRHLAKLKKTVVGIDMSMEALRLARSVFKKERLDNYLLVRGNILKMPFKQGSFDLLYGGGVIEHFEDTLQAVTELHRVLKPRGVAYNAVPHLNLGSLTYRQVWGNIPRFPILEPLMTFFHTKVLGARHMRFGFELSFTRRYLIRAHKRAGFSEVEAGQFRCPLAFEYFKWSPLRNLAIWLAENSSLFWPMIYIAATK